jgi:hypothetical protein
MQTLFLIRIIVNGQNHAVFCIDADVDARPVKRRCLVSAKEPVVAHLNAYRAVTHTAPAGALLQARAS